jgi:hypothetical protein
MSPFSRRYFTARNLRDLLERNDFRAEIHASFPLDAERWSDRARHSLRTVAIKLRLIPKSMKWKARLKRIFFGKLRRLPAELGPTLPMVQAVFPIDASVPQPGYKVLYAIGRRSAVGQHLAA